VPVRRIEYEYDWAGRLYERRYHTGLNSGPYAPPPVTTRYLYDGPNVIAELGRDDEDLVKYNHLPGTIDRPVSMEIGGQFFFYHYDERGSVIYLTNEQGHIVQRYWYDSFGRIALQIGNLHNIYTYTGRFWDPDAGVYHYRARAYDPDTGRFLQHDPIFSPNPYPYVNNDPINNVDPWGEYVDTIVDAASLSYDTYQYKKDPTVLNAVFVGMDILTMALPLAAGGGAAGRGVVKVAKEGYGIAKKGIGKIIKKIAGEGAEEVAEKAAKESRNKLKRKKNKYEEAVEVKIN